MNSQPKEQVGVCFKVLNPFYKKLKIKATEEDKSIKAYVIGLIENDLGMKNI
jgi:hypothetical protein